MRSLVDQLHLWMRRLRRLTRRAAVERAMDDEMRHHIACEIADRIRAGDAPDAARRAALRDFGGVERFKEEARDARGTRALEDVAADVRYAIRIVRRAPIAAAAIVLTFALGIAAGGAIFTFVYGVLLRPLPYSDPDRLVAVWERNVPRRHDRNVVSVANFEAWRTLNRSFVAMAALVPRPATLTHDGTPERVMGAEVSPGYFRLLGVGPAIGRDFDAADARVRGATPVILSHDLWAQRFGADPGVIGRTLRLSDDVCTIIGVMPRGFEPPRFGWLGAQALWFPFAPTPENRGYGRFLLVVARLRPEVTIARARAEMTALGDRLAVEMPQNRGWNVSVVLLAAQITGDASTALGVLLAAVVLLYLIAGANVATLMMSATRRRLQELAIRRSFGASDGRLFRQLFTQHALLALTGAAAGLFSIDPAVRLLVALAPVALPRLESVRVDATTLAPTLVVVGLTTMVLSAVASSARPPDSLRVASDAFVFDASRHRSSSALIVVEIAVALTLGVMATLMARSFVGLRSVDLGFDPERVIAARIAVDGRVADGPAARALFDDLVQRVRAMPGVEAAGAISARPLAGIGPATRVIDGLRPRDASNEGVIADVRFVSATLFETLRIPVRAGSTFDPRERDAGPIRVVVSERLAADLWPGQSAVGRTLGLDLFNDMRATIIGVVGDIHFADARTPARPAAYLSNARFAPSTADVVVRTAGDPISIVPALRETVGALAPGVPLAQVEPLARTVDAAIARERSTTFVLSAFAVIALLLGGVGVFGVVAGEVGRRRREIGLRMALGAGGILVAWLMLRQTIGRALVGVAIGAVAAVWLARSMTSLLFGVQPLDPASYGLTIALVLAAPLVATLIPVVQALRRSPLAALREG